MTGEHNKERRRAIEEAAEYGWTPSGVNRKGYTRMRCSCGKHTMWLPKTPGNRNTYRRKVARMKKVCTPPEPDLFGEVEP